MLQLLYLTQSTTACTSLRCVPIKSYPSPPQPCLLGAVDRDRAHGSHGGEANHQLLQILQYTEQHESWRECAQSSWICLVFEGSEHSWLAWLRCEIRDAVVRQGGATGARRGEGGHSGDRRRETGVLV